MNLNFLMYPRGANTTQKEGRCVNLIARTHIDVHVCFTGNEGLTVRERRLRLQHRVPAHKQVRSPLQSTIPIPRAFHAAIVHHEIFL